ncbi:MAG: hypothetical protein ACLT0W_05745 [Clostridium sp.]
MDGPKKQMHRQQRTKQGYRYPYQRRTEQDPVCDLKKIKRNSSITAAASVSKTYGDGAFALNVKKTGNGTLVYTVDNSDVVSVDANGTVTIKKAGTAVITVSWLRQRITWQHSPRRSQ